MAHHDLKGSGHRFRLRPLEVEDAAFVVKLRRDPALSRYINPTSPSELDQMAWTEAYFLRDNEYCFVVEDKVSGQREGTISIYNVDVPARQAEMGRWVLRPGSFAAPESVLLAYSLAFGPRPAPGLLPDPDGKRTGSLVPPVVRVGRGGTGAGGGPGRHEP